MADDNFTEEFAKWREHTKSQELYLKHYQLVCSASIVILMQLGFTFLEVRRWEYEFNATF